jgi:type I restriction enzyme M protein
MSDYSLRTIRQQFREQGLFYTPPELAKMVSELLPTKPTAVYDPTCGRGSLLAIFDDDVVKYGQDVDEAAVNDAQKLLTNFHGAVGDVLANPAFIDMRFDAIVANPPFSIKWHGIADGYFAFAPTVPSPSKADLAFLLHILWMLSDEGTAVVINSPGIGYRGGREATLRQWMIEQNVIDRVIHIPGNTFKDTAIATLCLVLKKRRETTDIIFVDREHDITRTVSRDEVERMGWTLSVNRYIQPPQEEKPTVDQWQLEQLARSAAIHRIVLELKTSHLVSQIAGWSFAEFAQEAHDAIDAYMESIKQSTHKDYL